ncbi:hypothetical protein E4U53_007262, partial [Claviceps sorghi]
MRVLLLALVAACGVSAGASYHGHRVYRVPVADEHDGAHLQRVIDKLGLLVWQPPSKKGFADMQVPPGRVAAFREAMKQREVITMHEDLGASSGAEHH